MICDFKTGAFEAGLKCKPCAFIYHDAAISHSTDVMGLLQILILMCSSVRSNVTILRFPDFEPNDYLYETHADKGDN